MLCWLKCLLTSYVRKSRQMLTSDVSIKYVYLQIQFRDSWTFTKPKKISNINSPRSSCFMIFLGFFQVFVSTPTETVPKRFQRDNWTPEAWESRLCRFRSVERPTTRVVLTWAEYWWLGRVGKKFPVTKKTPGNGDKHLVVVEKRPIYIIDARFLNQKTVDDLL